MELRDSSDICPELSCLAASQVGAGGGQFLRRLVQPRLPRLQRQSDTDVDRDQAGRPGGI